MQTRFPSKCYTVLHGDALVGLGASATGDDVENAARMWPLASLIERRRGASCWLAPREVVLGK